MLQHGQVIQTPPDAPPPKHIYTPPACMHAHIHKPTVLCQLPRSDPKLQDRTVLSDRAVSGSIPEQYRQNPLLCQLSLHPVTVSQLPQGSSSSTHKLRGAPTLTG